MTAAPTLSAAAGQAFDNLQARYAAGQMKTQLNLFWSINLPDFPESLPNGRPIMNWFVILASLEQKLVNPIPLQQLTFAAQVVYRLCWMAQYLQNTGAISNSQAQGLLGSYNTIIGFP